MKAQQKYKVKSSPRGHFESQHVNFANGFHLVSRRAVNKAVNKVHHSDVSAHCEHCVLDMLKMSKHSSPQKQIARLNDGFFLNCNFKTIEYLVELALTNKQQDDFT